MRDNVADSNSKTGKELNIKGIIKGILGILLFLLLPGIFGGIGAGVYFGIIKPQFEAGKILGNGAEAKALIIDVNSGFSVSSSSGSTTKNERYYYLRLSFVNSEGNEIEYRTRSIYPDEFIRKNHIDKGETVRVMYMGAKAVIKGYIPKYETWLWIFPVIFGGIAAGFLVLLVFSFVRSAMGKKSSS